jgi:hypothetical protein
MHPTRLLQAFAPFALAALFGCLISGLAPLQAQSLIPLTPASAIGGSPVFFNNAYNDLGSVYRPGNLFNQQSGVVDMSTQPGNAWFPSDTYGATNRFVTIDLGARYVLSSIEIFNSNQADRGTGSFSLSASNSTAAGGTEGSLPTGQVVSSPTVLLGATPLTSSTSNPVTGQTFSITDTTAYRYLTLTAINVPSSGGTFVDGMHFFEPPKELVRAMS